MSITTAEMAVNSIYRYITILKGNSYFHTDAVGDEHSLYCFVHHIAEWLHMQSAVLVDCQSTGLKKTKTLSTLLNVGGQ